MPGSQTSKPSWWSIFLASRHPYRPADGRERVFTNFGDIGQRYRKKRPCRMRPWRSCSGHANRFGIGISGGNAQGQWGRRHPKRSLSICCCWPLCLFLSWFFHWLGYFFSSFPIFRISTRLFSCLMIRFAPLGNPRLTERLFVVVRSL